MAHNRIKSTAFLAGCFLFFVTMIMCQRSEAEEIVTNLEGRQIVLHGDGTWTYVPPIDSLNGNFRDALWGMSQRDVMVLETWTLTRTEPNVLVYSGTISDLKFLCTYFFKDDKLVGAEYTVQGQTPEKPDCITNFKNLTTALRARYGDPIQEKQYWKDIRFKYDYDHWGLAVSVGHLSFYTKWQTNDTRIVAYLNGIDFDINLGVEYLCRDSSLYRPADEKQAMLENF